MEWQQIRAFACLARLGSYTRTAEATSRTQSAVSQQIKALEEELGCALVERTGRKQLELTPAGERFLGFCRTVLGEQDQLLQELGQMKEPLRGRLRIAAPFTTIYHLLPGVLRDFRNRFPAVELTLLDRGQMEVIRLVKEGEVHLGLALESRIPADMIRLRWKKVEPVLMVPQGHVLTRAKRVSLREVAAHPLILPAKESGGGSRDALERVLLRLGLPYRVAMESSNVELSSLYVEMGLGVSFATVARELPLLAGRRLAFLPLEKHFKADYVAVFRRKDQRLTSWLRYLLENLPGANAKPGG